MHVAISGLYTSFTLHSVLFSYKSLIELYYWRAIISSARVVACVCFHFVEVESQASGGGMLVRISNLSRGPVARAKSGWFRPVTTTKVRTVLRYRPQHYYSVAATLDWKILSKVAASWAVSVQTYPLPTSRPVAILSASCSLEAISTA